MSVQTLVPDPSAAADLEAIQERPAYDDYAATSDPSLPTHPIHWKMQRLKTLVDSPVIKAPDVERPFVALEHVESGTGRLVADYEPRIVPTNDYALFQKSDVLFGKLRPYLRKHWYAEFDGCCPTELLVLRPRNSEIDPRFLFRWVQSDYFIAVADSSSYGTKMPRTSWEVLGSSVTFIPPLDEQRAIAGFLDRETAKIDALVEKKQRLIELLQEKRAALISHAVTTGLDPDAPMKDSGVEWLGEVPAHWQVRRLKGISTVQTGVTMGKRYGQNTHLTRRPYLRVANVQDGYLALTDVTEVEIPTRDVQRYELRAGDVLMTEGGDNDKLGRGYVWEGEIPGCLHQNHIFAVRPDQRYLDPYFLSLLVSSAYGRAYFTGTSKQTTNLASINGTNLGKFPVPLPPEPEQQAILDKLEDSLTKLSILNHLIETHIERLHEYRTALISAAVTGKIDVRGEVETA